MSDARSMPATFHPRGYVEGGKFYPDSTARRAWWWLSLPFKIVVYPLALAFFNYFIALIFFPAFVVIGVLEVFALLIWMGGGFRKKRGVYEGDCPHCERHFYLAGKLGNCPICTKRVIVENDQFVAL